MAKKLIRRQLGGNLPFEAIGRAKLTGGAGIYQKHYRQFPLFDIPLDKRFTHAGGHFPINGTHFVAGLVGTHFIEFHPPPFENGVVFSGKAVVDQAGAYFNTANFYQFSES
jgi:hypothetical protein